MLQYSVWHTIQDFIGDTVLNIRMLIAVISLYFVFKILEYLLRMYSGTSIVFLRYSLGTLIGCFGLLFVGLLLFLAKGGRFHNEGGRRRH